MTTAEIASYKPRSPEEEDEEELERIVESRNVDPWTGY
jgi:hypothetical protein